MCDPGSETAQPVWAYSNRHQQMCHDHQGKEGLQGGRWDVEGSSLEFLRRKGDPKGWHSIDEEVPRSSAPSAGLPRQLQTQQWVSTMLHNVPTQPLMSLVRHHQLWLLCQLCPGGTWAGVSREMGSLLVSASLKLSPAGGTGKYWKPSPACQPRGEHPVWQDEALGLIPVAVQCHCWRCSTFGTSLCQNYLHPHPAAQNSGDGAKSSRQDSPPRVCREALTSLCGAAVAGGRSESGPKCLQISLSAKPARAEGVKRCDRSLPSRLPPPRSPAEAHRSLSFFFFPRFFLWM